MPDFKRVELYSAYDFNDVTNRFYWDVVVVDRSHGITTYKILVYPTTPVGRGHMIDGADYKCVCTRFNRRSKKRDEQQINKATNSIFRKLQETF